MTYWAFREPEHLERVDFKGSTNRAVGLFLCLLIAVPAHHFALGLALNKGGAGAESYLAALSLTTTPLPSANWQQALASAPQNPALPTNVGLAAQFHSASVSIFLIACAVIFLMQRNQLIAMASSRTPLPAKAQPAALNFFVVFTLITYYFVIIEGPASSRTSYWHARYFDPSWEATGRNIYFLAKSAGAAFVFVIFIYFSLVFFVLFVLRPLRRARSSASNGQNLGREL